MTEMKTETGGENFKAPKGVVERAETQLAALPLLAPYENFRVASLGESKLSADALVRQFDGTDFTGSVGYRIDISDGEVRGATGVNILNSDQYATTRLLNQPPDMQIGADGAWYIKSRIPGRGDNRAADSIQNDLSKIAAEVKGKYEQYSTNHSSGDGTDSDFRGWLAEQRVKGLHTKEIASLKLERDRQQMLKTIAARKVQKPVQR